MTDRVRVGSVVHDVADIDRAIAFWTAALGYEADPLDDDRDFCVLRDPSGRRGNVSLQLSAEPKPDRWNRVHLDLYTHDREAEVRRLLELGALPVPGGEHEDHTVLRDPDGNEFCVCGSFRD